MVCKCMLACKNGSCITHCITHLNFLSITSVRIHIMFMIMVDFLNRCDVITSSQSKMCSNCSSSIAKY